MTCVVAVCRDDFPCFRAHRVFERRKRFLIRTALQIKNFVRVCVERHIADLAHAERITCSKLIKKLLCRLHCRCVARAAAEVAVHRVGDVHHDHDRHIGLLDNLTDCARRAYLQCDVEHVFQVRSGNRLAHADAVAALIAATLFFNLPRRGCIRTLHQSRCILCKQSDLTVIVVIAVICRVGIFLKPAAVAQQHPVGAHARLGNCVIFVRQQRLHARIERNIVVIRQLPVLMRLLQLCHKLLRRRNILVCQLLQRLELLDLLRKIKQECFQLFFRVGRFLRLVGSGSIACVRVPVFF